jgi:hypothetical protein
MLIDHRHCEGKSCIQHVRTVKCKGHGEGDVCVKSKRSPVNDITNPMRSSIIITSRALQSFKEGTKDAGEGSNRILSISHTYNSPNKSINKSTKPINLNFPHRQLNLNTLSTNPPSAQMQLPTTLLRRSIARPSFLPSITSTSITTRPFSQTLPTQARKDTQDKDSLKPEPNEYSKSGSDDAAAATEKAAFDPSSTRPEEEQAMAGRESGDDVSWREPTYPFLINQYRFADLSFFTLFTGQPPRSLARKPRHQQRQVRE